jgi:hypothetical protein
MKALYLLPLLSVGLCHSHEEGGAGADEYFYDCENPNRPAGLMTFATDEAYRDFSDKVTALGLKKDDTQAAQLTAPAADSTLSLAAPPTFTFTAGMTDRSTPINSPTVRRPSRWAQVKSALAFEGTAWAHCPAVTGTLYLIELKEPGAQAAAYSALTSVLSFTPNKDVWNKKLGSLSGKKVSLTLARGVFSMGTLQLGPFVSSKDLTFTVGP